MPSDTPSSRSPNAEGRYPRVSPEQLPGIEPLIFRQIGRRIAFPLLESGRLPDDFLITEDKDRRGSLLFGGRRWDLNITVFKPRDGPRGRCKGSGVFVVSNGAGVATNTVESSPPSAPTCTIWCEDACASARTSSR